MAPIHNCVDVNARAVCGVFKNRKTDARANRKIWRVQLHFCWVAGIFQAINEVEGLSFIIITSLNFAPLKFLATNEGRLCAIIFARQHEERLPEFKILCLCIFSWNMWNDWWWWLVGRANVYFIWMDDSSHIWKNDHLDENETGKKNLLLT